MMIHDGPRRLEARGVGALFDDFAYMLDTQWFDGGGWLSEEKWLLNRQQTMRLQEDIRRWLQENPE